MNPLALPRLAAFYQGQQDTLGQIHARRKVGDGDADPHGALSRQTRDGHQSAHALGDLIDTGTFRDRAGLPKA